MNEYIFARDQTKRPGSINIAMLEPTCSKYLPILSAEMRKTLSGT
jgi:hypothetical protein